MPSMDVLGVQHSYKLTDPVNARPVLVFVHGWLLSRHYWEPLVQRLAPTFQCLTYDLRGFGESGIATAAEAADLRQTIALGAATEGIQACVRNSVASPYALVAYAQDLVLLLKQLDLPQVWLVGHSLGGSIALWAAALAPARIEGVVCLNAGGGIYVKEAFERFRQAGQQIVGLRPPWLPLVPLLDRVFSRLMVHRPLEQHWGKQRLVDFVAAHPEAARRSLLDSTLPSEVHLLPQVVAHLQQPVHFLAGQQDRVMELKYVYHLASFHHSFYSGGQTVVELPQCGHMGMVEQPDVISQTLQHLVVQPCSSSLVA